MAQLEFAVQNNGDMLGLIAWLAAAAQAEGPRLPDNAVQRLFPLRFRHEAPVLQAALSGSRLYSLDAAGFLSAWETTADRRLYRVEAQGARSLTASADGSVLVIVGLEGLRIVDATTGAERRRLAGSDRPALSADGRLLAALEGKTIRRWSVDKGDELPRLENELELRALAVSAHGARIAAADAWGWAVWNGETGKRVAWHQETFPPTSLALSADGRRLAVGDLWDTRIYDLEETGLKLRQTPPVIASQALAFSGDGTTLSALHRGRLAQIWNLPRNESVAEWRVEGDLSTERLALSSDGEAIVRIRGDGLQILSGKEDIPTAAAFLPDGRALTASADGLRIWDLSTGWSERSRPGPPLPAVAFSKDARTVLLRSAQEVVVWDRAAARELFRTKDERLDAAALSPDGARVAVHARGRTSIWDVATGVALRVQDEPEREVSALALSPDGTLVAKGHADGALSLMKVSTGRDVLQFAPRRNARVAKVAFSPDGDRVVTGDEAGEVRVWEEGKQPILSQTHEHPVFALAFSPDGRQVVGAAIRGDILVSAADLPNTVLLRLPRASPSAVAFSPDGRRLLSGDRAGAIFVWAVPDPK